MLERITSSGMVARALRVVLVFALVFWSTFHVQAIAYAALISDPASGHEPGTLSDLDIWEVDKADSARVATFVRDARDTAAGAVQTADIKVSSNNGATTFVALPAWGESTTANSQGDIAVADFVEWSVSDSGIASLQATGGVATLTGHAPGTVTVTCRLASGANALKSPTYPGGNIEASFTVHVVSPYVSSLEIHKPDGSVCYDNEEIVLADADRSAYGLTARVNVFDEATGSTMSFETSPGLGLFDASGGMFADLVWQVLNEAEAEVPPSEAVVENGLVNLVGDGPVIVRCISQDGLNGIPLSAQVVVKSNKAASPDTPVNPQDPQGADHHQDQLTVTINASEPTAPEEGTPTDTPEGEGQDASESEDPELQTQADEPSSKDAASSSASASSEAPASGDSARSTDDETEKDAVKSGSTTYSLADLQAALDFGTETYTMRSGDGFTVVTGEGPSLAALLDFAGIPLAQQANIESIEFMCGGSSADTVTVSWSDLVAANVFYPGASEGKLESPARSVTMLAARSYVHSADEPASTPASKDKLLDNTRFRLLYGSGGGDAMANPDAFRWISGIVVNMNGAGNKPAPVVDPGDDPQVFVDYVPVPRGETAILSPRYYLPPSISGGSVQFSYIWETSADGATWEPVRDSSSAEGDSAAASTQALHVLTDDSTIGTYRRFVLNISQYDGKTGEEVQSSINSTPVKIRVAGEKSEGEAEEIDAGYIVALDYIPPIAGDVANFTAKTTITDSSIKAADVDYEWQMSVDGGLSWTGRDDADCPDLLRNQSGKMCTTLRIPTQPIEERKPTDSAESDGEGSSDSGDDGSAAQLVYIRVVAHYPGHRSVASNAQPLTVHVGETSGGKKAEDIEEELNKSNSSASPESGTTPETPSSEPPAPTPSTPQVQVTEIDSVVFEDPSVPTPAEEAPAQAPTQNSAPTQVYVNTAVSEIVVEQKAAEAQVAASTPGYRWTQLSTIDASDDDVRAILGVNPLAPFAAPMALGLTAAGVVEKIVGFRRQTR